MASRVTVEWRGDEYRKKVVQAVKDAIDDVTAETDQIASTSHWWRSRTGNLERKIITEHAVHVGHHVTGKVGVVYGGGVKGVRDAFYGLFLEMREPFLRPAADITFPTLISKIKRRLQ